MEEKLQCKKVFKFNLNIHANGEHEREWVIQLPTTTVWTFFDLEKLPFLVANKSQCSRRKETKQNMKSENITLRRWYYFHPFLYLAMSILVKLVFMFNLVIGKCKKGNNYLWISKYNLNNCERTYYYMWNIEVKIKN